MTKPTLKVVGKSEESDITDKEEYPPKFVDALYKFLQGSEYLSYVMTEDIEEFTIVFKDESGIKLLGDVNDPDILKSRLSAAEWALNFQEQIGIMQIEDDT